MRTLLLTALLLGAAAAQAGDPPAPAPSPATEAKPEPAKPAEKTLEQKIAEAKKAGYKLVDQNGTQLYCRERRKTGSRLEKETECLTERQIEQLGDLSRRGLADITRQQPPPQGR